MSLNIGRKGFFELAPESTYGVPVAVTDVIPFNANSFKGKQEPIQNQAAYGVREKRFSSVIGKQWSEGDIEVNLDATLAPWFIYGALGDSSTATVSGSVKDHTMTRDNSNTPASFTVVNDRITDRQYANGVAVASLEIGVSDGFASAKASLLGKFPITTTSGTLTTTSGSLFAFKDAFFAFGSTVAAAAAGTNLKPHDFKLNINNNSEAVYRFGSANPDTINHKEFEVEAEGSIYFESTTDRDRYYNNSKQAAVLKFTGVGIGGGFSEAITFNLYQTAVDDFELETGLADFYAQKMKIMCEYDNANSKSIDAVVRNVKSIYV